MRRFICFCLVFLASSSWAEGVKNQWKSSDESLNGLVKKGFNIISVTRLPDKSNEQHSRWEEVFFLQKAGSVYKCFEEHYTNIKTNEHEASFMCFELVEVYSSRK